MKLSQIRGLIACLAGVSLAWSAQAGKFYFPVGISYGAGIHDATDKLFHFYEQDGFDVDRIDVPVGLTLNPYYEWDSGLGLGVTVGPTAFIYVQEKYYSNFGSSSTDKFSYAVPVGGFLRYTLWHDRAFAPFVKAGVRYPLAGGDNLASSDIGPFGAVGIDLWRNKKVGVSVEAGYDSSKIKVKYTSQDGGERSEKVTFTGFTIGVAVQF